MAIALNFPTLNRKNSPELFPLTRTAHMAFAKISWCFFNDIFNDEGPKSTAKKAASIAAIFFMTFIHVLQRPLIQYCLIADLIITVINHFDFISKILQTTLFKITNAFDSSFSTVRIEDVTGS